jgi:hypothetical protein
MDDIGIDIGAHRFVDARRARTCNRRRARQCSGDQRAPTRDRRYRYRCTDL